jgi:hypothetical protein
MSQFFVDISTDPIDGPNYPETSLLSSEIA